MTKPVVSVVGSFAVGMTIRAPHFPVAGETLRGSDFDMGPGGKGSNQAVGLARLGIQSHLIARLGDDSLGRIGLDLYAAEGVGVSGISLSRTKPTGVGTIVLNDAGENFIILDMGANNEFAPAHIDDAKELIQASQIVTAVLEIPTETALYALALAHRAGKQTILNPAPADRIDPAFFEVIDVFTPNQSELHIMNGYDPRENIDPAILAGEMQRKGAKDIIVTLGAQGCVWFSSDGAKHAFPARKVNVVDTTGAGDAFNAALTAGLASGKDIASSIPFALTAGALACTRLGVIPSLPTLAEIQNTKAG